MELTYIYGTTEQVVFDISEDLRDQKYLEKKEMELGVSGDGMHKRKMSGRTSLCVRGKKIMSWGKSRRIDKKENNNNNKKRKQEKNRTAADGIS